MKALLLQVWSPDLKHQHWLEFVGNAEPQPLLDSLNKNVHFKISRRFT